MPHRAATAATVLLVTLLPGCRRAEPRAPAVQATQDTGFAGTTAPLQRLRALRPGVPPGMLRAVASSAGPASLAPGFDRIVFEFTGDSVPGYHVEYATQPVRRCGSGAPVSVAGAAQLVVRFEPASAHDARGASAALERRSAPGLPAVRELELVCDFEGQVEWVVGVAAREPYRVAELARPARLVLDVAHAR